MKKKKWVKKGNVFLFPGTADTLIQKGREALENKNFDEAVWNLSEALTYALDEEEDVKTALLLALYESGRYEEALGLSTEMLREGVGEYYDVLDIYLLILIQQKQYQEIFSTLTILMEEKQLPEEKRAHFAQLLQVSTKMMEEPPEPERPLFTGEESLREQTMKMIELVHANIQPYATELSKMLENKRTHPFLQTLILNVLKEHAYDKPLQMQKFHYTGIIVPAALSDVFEMEYYKEVIAILEEKLLQQNPVLLEQVKEIVKRQFFLLYPFEPTETAASMWAAACLRLIEVYYKGESELTNEEEEPDLVKSLAFIKELDEISSPIV